MRAASPVSVEDFSPGDCARIDCLAPRLQDTVLTWAVSIESVAVQSKSCRAALNLDGQGVSEHTTFDKSDFRSNVPRFAPQALEANMALVALVQAVASRKKATPAQVALAWLLAQKPRRFRAPKSSTGFEENLEAVGVELTSRDLNEIGTALAKITLQANRLPDAALSMTGLTDSTRKLRGQ